MLIEPVFSAVGVVLKLVVATTPSSDHMFPHAEVEIVEIVFENQILRRDRGNV